MYSMMREREKENDQIFGVVVVANEENVRERKKEKTVGVCSCIQCQERQRSCSVEPRARRKRRPFNLNRIENFNCEINWVHF